jgi:hypothetical protein
LNGLGRTALVFRPDTAAADLSAGLYAVGKIRRVLEALVAEPEDVEAGLVAGDDLVEAIGAPAALRLPLGPGRLALVAVGDVVEFDELVEVGAGEATLLQGEVHFRPEVGN